ncbi:helix-turn-helix transcriptional regulator [Aquincola sp. S2]|uniref:Helix-turn-helix transcriptional regulator n=1 Tax=Pseudaquabacterium terrae TaxID=2732868 RepID=A0ABX2EDH3_9BURK|nr:AraC family transcriptional regulator [Aquabacterium terrae]NRF66220.1 helix-turn-helix transcriptional regulator [Aquabacterium terrae]
MSTSPPVAEFAVCRELLRSQAAPLRSHALGSGGAWLVQWRNADTETAYHQPGHHTLSLYLQGGEQVRCLDQPAARGAPGSLCCMPAGHESRWHVNGSLQLLHLYLPTLPLALAAECWFDRDPRLADLQDRIYFDDAVLHALGRRIVALDWDHSDASLALQELALQMQARLLSAHGATQRPPAARLAARGGLSPAARRRVLDCIESAPAGSSPGLDALADAACLSSYHFVRMFKASFGLSPHAWVMQRRLAKARALLAAGRLPLQQVADQAGYAHLSHLNAALQRAGLGSAARYRRVISR